jgi:hypothetical protein
LPICPVTYVCVAGDSVVDAPDNVMVLADPDIITDPDTINPALDILIVRFRVARFGNVVFPIGIFIPTL